MAIGIYDSGIGGLTVYQAVASKFKDLDIIYLGDSARVPYGNKSPETIVRYSLQCGRYLSINYDISALIVACNTISSHALPALRKTLGIPVLGVIKPGAANAVALTKNKKIAVLGTHATINSGSYIKAVRDTAEEEIEVYQQACPLFVPLVEEAMTEGAVTETVARETLKDIARSGADTVILGCTHYPVLKDVIKRIMPGTNIVDSSQYIIKDIENLGINLKEKGVRQILITDESPAFRTLKNLLAGDAPVKAVNI